MWVRHFISCSVLLIITSIGMPTPHRPTPPQTATLVRRRKETALTTCAQLSRIYYTRGLMQPLGPFLWLLGADEKPK